MVIFASVQPHFDRIFKGLIPYLDVGHPDTPNALTPHQIRFSRNTFGLLQNGGINLDSEHQPSYTPPVYEGTVDEYGILIDSRTPSPIISLPQDCILTLHDLMYGHDSQGQFYFERVQVADWNFADISWSNQTEILEFRAQQPA